MNESDSFLRRIYLVCLTQLMSYWHRFWRPNERLKSKWQPLYCCTPKFSWYNKCRKWSTIFQSNNRSFVFHISDIMVFYQCVSEHIKNVSNGPFVLSFNEHLHNSYLLPHGRDVSSFLKSTIVVNFTNILHAACAPVSFFQKITYLNWKNITATQNTFVQKSCS